MKQWHFFDKVYRPWVVLFIGSAEEFKHEMESVGYGDVGGIKPDGAAGMCIHLNPDNNSNGNRCTVIWMPEWSTTTFVHELAHLIVFEFDRCNMDVSIDSQEPFAFLFEYWFTEITRARKRLPDGRTPVQAKRGI